MFAINRPQIRATAHIFDAKYPVFMWIHPLIRFGMSRYRYSSTRKGPGRYPGDKRQELWGLIDQYRDYL